MDIDPRLPRGVVTFIQKAHAGQVRKHGTPYWEHPHAVACIVLDAWPEAPLWIITAALLHDVLEQCDTDREQLQQAYDAHIATAVDLLSIPPTRPKDLQAYYQRLAKADVAIRCIKLADRIHNLQQLPLSGDKVFMRRYIAQTEQYLLDLVGEKEAQVCAPARSLRDLLHTTFQHTKDTLVSG